VKLNFIFLDSVVMKSTYYIMKTTD